VLCKEKKRDPVFGVDLNFFSSLVNDKEDAAGCYCTDVELSSAITKVATAGVVIATLPQSTPKAKPPPPVGDAGPANAHLSRGQLIEVVFNTLDGDKDGRLNQREMKVFAKFTGFEGSEAEWDEAYKSLCADAGGGSSVDLRGFTTIVDDPSDETTDSDLRSMLEKLRVAVPVMVPPATPPPPKAGANASAGETIPGGAPRDELVRAVFTALDADKDAVLSQWEMYAFAERVGFRGGSLKASKDDALTRDIAFFQRLVDDKSAETGCYCTDEELRSTLEKLSAHNAASAKARSKASSVAKLAEQSRPELVKALFLRLDVDRDGKLSPSEMRRFAEQQDFEGSEEDWAEAYKELCTEKGRDPAHGVDLSLFTQLVDDESEETGCYCTDDEMRTMLTKLPSS
jgi:Ca2+-binding EF-hand superfamily protein